ncbi:hypothetical protein KPATCC21470_7065 [Kitasatospora purpeofusca]
MTPRHRSAELPHFRANGRLSVAERTRTVACRPAPHPPI